MSQTFSRRTFLARSAQYGVAGAALLSAPKLLDVRPATAAARQKAMLGKANLQLSWIENVEFDGSYIAATKGYYTDAGLNVTLLSGGPNVAELAVVASGKALVGLADSVVNATANNQGADLKVIAAGYQKSPYAMMSMAKNPIKTPKDMIGKRIGVPAGDLNGWEAFLKINGIPLGKVHSVPVQFDPSVLPAGEVDGFISYFQEEPSELAAKGYKVFVFLWEDYGFHILTETYAVKASALANATQRAQIVALMTGEVRGYQDAVKDPAYGAKLTVDVFGKSLGLALAEQTNEAKRAIPLMVTPDTQKHGLFWMTDQKVAETIKTLKVAGVKTEASMFTNEILEEIYKGKSRI